MPGVDLVREAQSGKERGEEKGWVEGRIHSTLFPETAIGQCLPLILMAVWS